MKDREIKMLIDLEKSRLHSQTNLIASENIPSADVLWAMGSCLSTKYSEGEIGKRYYQGNKVIDEIEKICKKRLLKLFKCQKNYRANVQVTSGAIANLAVYLAFLEKGDKILSMKLSDGAHITHGLKSNFSGQFYEIINYGLNENGEIDYDEMERLAINEKPQLIIAGCTAYSKKINFKRFGQIARRVGALLMVDASHIIGLIATHQHPNPFPWSDILTSTTQKTLRGPRSAFIIVRKEFEDKLNKTVFPGILGGPKNNEIAAKAVCFKEASTPEFHNYIKQVLHNTLYLCDKCKEYGFKIVSGGTENHLFVIDLSEEKFNGKDFAIALEKEGIIINANTIPNDKGNAWKPSGIRIGCALETTKGIKKTDLAHIAWIMNDVKDKLRNERRLE